MRSEEERERERMRNKMLINNKFMRVRIDTIVILLAREVRSIRCKEIRIILRVDTMSSKRVK